LSNTPQEGISVDFPFGWKKCEKKKKKGERKGRNRKGKEKEKEKRKGEVKR
jgi:hypothetical protein